MTHAAFKALSLDEQRAELLERLQQRGHLRLVPVNERRPLVHRGLKWTGPTAFYFRRIDDPQGRCIQAECRRCLERFENVQGAYQRLRTHLNRHEQADAFQASLQIEFDALGIVRTARRDIHTGRLVKGD